MAWENSGEWLIRKLHGPEKLQKIGNLLPWGVLLVGVVIFLLGFGIDLDVEPQQVVLG